MKELKKIGLNTPNNVFIVAEIGINHGGSVDTAKRLIRSAAVTGVDAVKFQTYITEKRTFKGSPIFDILKKCELPFKAFKELSDCAAENNIGFFSTPFDDESVDILEAINCRIYKVASFDVINYKFLNKISGTKKTVIMSTGMSSLQEIKKAFEVISANTGKIALLHCVSSYPTKEEDADLAAIGTLKNEFDCIVGHSDHTDGISVPLYAVAVGAQIIEKHYMIDRKMDCVDAPVSITEEQMKELVLQTRRLEGILGSGKLSIRPVESGASIFRRPG